MEESFLDPTFAVILYCAISPILAWLNKFVLVVPFCSQGLRNGPFLVTFFQQLSTFFVLTVVDLLLRLSTIAKKRRTVSRTITKATGLAPAAVCFVAQLTLCNACLRAIPMSSYQATRSSSLIFSILVNRLILFEPISFYASISCAVVGTGFVLSVFDPAQTTCYSSVIFGVLASLAGVLFMTVCRQKVREATLSEMEIARWVSFDSALILLPFVIYEFSTTYEYGSIFFSPSNVSLSSDSVSSLSTVGAALIATMLLAPLIPICTATCLKQMTPLGCTIVGFAKSSLQSIAGNWLFGDPLSTRSLLGVTLCLVGCFMYSFSGNKKKRD